MTDVWNTINESIKLTNVHPRNLKIGDIYIVDYTDIDVKEKYRAKLIHILSGSQEKYKVKVLFNFIEYNYILTNKLNYVYFSFS